MFVKRLTLAAVALSFVLGSFAAQAQESGALLDLLVRKRIITDQEAEEIRGELTKEYSATSAGKLKISSPLTELELYGDGRVRYEVRNGNSGAAQHLRHQSRRRAAAQSPALSPAARPARNV